MATLLTWIAGDPFAPAPPLGPGQRHGWTYAGENWGSAVAITPFPDVNPEDNLGTLLAVQNVTSEVVPQQWWNINFEIVNIGTEDILSYTVAIGQD